MSPFIATGTLKLSRKHFYIFPSRIIAGIRISIELLCVYTVNFFLFPLHFPEKQSIYKTPFVFQGNLILTMPSKLCNEISLLPCLFLFLGIRIASLQKYRSYLQKHAVNVWSQGIAQELK